jgi:hypothetical protein
MIIIYTRLKADCKMALKQRYDKTYVYCKHDKDLTFIFFWKSTIKQGIVIGSQIRDLMKNNNFSALLKGTEKLLG